MDPITVSVKLDAKEATEGMAALQAQADKLLATLKECSGACAECKLVTSPKELIAVLRAENYRELRTQ